MAVRTIKLKNLNINPFSLVKFFYEKLGARTTEQPFIQPLIYLVYSEILKKENILLFKEEFRAGEVCPFLPSLRELMGKDDKELIGDFRRIPDINNYQVLPYLEKLVKKYADSFACEIQYKSQDRL